MQPAAPASEGPWGLCLAGPTGAGKTALALAFAERHAVEIISVDSALVYRGMDIGTAKPSPAERAAVPHHLIDILDPRDSYSAAAFAADATRLAAEIRSRGRTPLLVGGTMLYFKALREGLHAMPAADPALRAAIDAEAARRGWPALHAELARIDPATAARLAPADAQRIQRALEVYRLSGRPLSEWHAPDARLASPQGMAAGRAAADAKWPMVSLEPRSRGWLHERIAQRFARMMQLGLLQEVQALHARGDLHTGLPSMRCVGYRQLWDLCAPGATPGDGLAHALAAAVAATRQLAKRQLTWLRSVATRHVVPCDDHDALALGLAALESLSIQRTRAVPGI